MEDTAYHDGSGTYPADIDDNVYSDSSAGSTMVEADYKL